MKLLILLKLHNLIRKRFYNYNNYKKEKFLRSLIPFKIKYNRKILPIFLKNDYDIIDIIYRNDIYFNFIRKILDVNFFTNE